MHVDLFYICRYVHILVFVRGGMYANFLYCMLYSYAIRHCKFFFFPPSTKLRTALDVFWFVVIPRCRIAHRKCTSLTSISATRWCTTGSMDTDRCHTPIPRSRPRTNDLLQQSPFRFSSVRQRIVNADLTASRTYLSLLIIQFHWWFP